MDDVDDLDELELIDQHELEASSEDESRSGAESEEDEPSEALSEAQYSQLKSTVIGITTAMGGLEEVMGEGGEVGTVYVLGHDCLRCLRDLRTLWRDDDDNPHRVVARVFAEVNLLQTGLLPLLLKATDMGERGNKVALACSECTKWLHRGHEH